MIRLLSSFVVVLALVGTACGGEEAPASTGVDEFVAATASGGQVDFNALEGSDVLLWFWAPW